AYRKRFSDSCVLIGTLGVSEYGDFSHYFLNKQSPIDTATVPGGYPLRGVNVRLFNENKGAEDSEGEIGITGPFIEDNVPYPERYAAHTNQDGSISTYYLTGDLGEMAADGCIYHRGRKDFQVKIRGNRVDLLAVEAALLDIEGVSHAAVIADTDDPLDVRLIAYLEGTIHDARALRENLENQIPAYMIPSRFVFLESLPRTLTGKIDKRSLPKPELASPIETDSGPGTDEFPPTEIEIQILQIWKDVLQVDKVGIHDHFLERGGDSIKAMMVLARLNRQFDIQLSLRELFDNESVSKIAEAVQALL
ncbi:MAG: AMP-binding protein, partial [Verrucomicrobiae bacterium]|nr:AMP-binding protein [Verrucomicrobiae bacterium]